MELGLSIEMEISGRAFAIRYYVDPGGLWWTNVLNSALPPQRHRPDTQLEHHDPISHTAQKKREKKRNKDIKKNRIKIKKEKSKKKRKPTDRTLGQMVKAKQYRKNHTKKYTHTHSQKEKK